MIAVLRGLRDDLRADLGVARAGGEVQRALGIGDALLRVETLLVDALLDPGAPAGVPPATSQESGS